MKCNKAWLLLLNRGDVVWRHWWKASKDYHCLLKASGVKRAGRKSLLVNDKRKREKRKRIKKEIVPRKQWNPYNWIQKTNVGFTTETYNRKKWHWTLGVKLCWYRFSASCCSQGFLLHFDWGVLPVLQGDDQHFNMHFFNTCKAVWWMLIDTF